MSADSASLAIIEVRIIDIVGAGDAGVGTYYDTDPAIVACIVLEDGTRGSP
jgi:hypothetical protein